MTIPAHTAAFAESVRLLLDLHVLYCRGLDESDAADAIRDAMDGPWYAMTEDEQARVRRLSADLYTIGERHREAEPAAEVTASFERARTEQDWVALSALLQEHAGLAEPAWRSRLRGAVWAGLGVPAAAVLFLEDALSASLVDPPAAPASPSGSTGREDRPRRFPRFSRIEREAA